MKVSTLRKLLLLPFSWMYGLAVAIRNLLYRTGLFASYAVDGVPIVSIGNLSVGGTGKTPMAEFLIRYLAQNGLRAAYLSRGYGRDTRGYLRVNPAEHAASETGDEALQVASKFPTVPVAVCADRVAGAQQLLQEAEFDVLLLDDAFQHRRIRRDLDILMVDANRPPWLDALLPAGRLREPQRAMRRAQLVVVNKLSQKRFMAMFNGKLQRQCVFSQLVPVRLAPCFQGEPIGADHLKRRSCLAFSGLGNNEAFFNELQRLGMSVVNTYRFADHHRFAPRELQRILHRYRRLNKQDVFAEPLVIVTTEKDYIRLRDLDWFQLQFAQYPIYFLEVQLQVLEGAELLDAAFKPLLATAASAAPHAGRLSAAV